MTQSVVRNIELKEVEAIPKNLQEWTSGFIEVPGTVNVLSSPAFDPAGCFVAENKGSIVGYVAVTSLPRKNWIIIRYLTAKNALSRVYAVEKLRGRALEYIETRKPEFFRATTPSMQPYVDVYKSFGFKAVRRDFRITWNLTEAFQLQNKQVEIKEIDDKTAEKAADVLVRSIRPYWNWRTQEQGGDKAVARK